MIFTPMTEKNWYAGIINLAVQIKAPHKESENIFVILTFVEAAWPSG